MFRQRTRQPAPDGSSERDRDAEGDGSAERDGPPRAAPSVTAGPKARMGRPGYDLDSLVTAAAEVFTERGYDGTTMEVLAATLGVGKSAIYHHVASREELLGLALDRALDGLDGVVARAQNSEAPAGIRLEQLIHDSVEVLLDRLPSVTLLVRARGNSEVERRALSRRRDFDRFVAALVQQAMAEGDLRADLDATIVARLLFGLVNSVTEWYRPRLAGSDLDIASTICAMAFHGLRTAESVVSSPSTSPTLSSSCRHPTPT